MRTIKIFEDEKEIYSGACSVNTAILRGRLCDKIDHQGDKVVRFSVQYRNPARLPTKRLKYVN